MPYLLISTQVRLETGPTLCGDEYSDPAVMEKLGAILQEDSGKKFRLYISEHPARVILNLLELDGYHVVTATGVGQTCVWTLYKEASSN